MSDPAPPREPEIEFLGKIARAGLRTIRVVLWLAGLAALLTLVRPQWFGIDGSALAGRLAFACASLVLMTDSAWWLGRTKWWMLGGSAVLWFAPMAMPGDSDYGFVLRMFATLSAFLTILVWRNLWLLTRPQHAAD